MLGLAFLLCGCLGFHFCRGRGHSLGGAFSPQKRKKPAADAVKRSDSHSEDLEDGPAESSEETEEEDEGGGEEDEVEELDEGEREFLLRGAS